MLTDDAGETGLGSESSGDTTLLRNWLVSGAILLDGQERISVITPDAATLLGITIDPQAELGLEVLPLAVQEVVRAAANTAVADRRIELSVPGRGTVMVRLSAFRTQAGSNAQGVLLLLRDVASVRRIEEHLQRLDRLANLGTLSASLAHEFRNALVACRTFIDLLIEKNKDAELGEVVRRELERMDSLVAQMLRFGGLGKPAFAVVHIHQALDHVLCLLQPQIQAKSVAVERVFGAAPDVIWGDGHQLQQAFVNLFLNAVEAMASFGSLTLATELVSPRPEAAAGGLTNGRWLRVKVQDTGCGIPREQMSRLFEPFFTTKADGTGLGLPITQRIIQEHRGAISVESTAGKGTAFTLLLPAGNGPQGR
jgi:two-component system sensor histidine kinase HydH